MTKQEAEGLLAILKRRRGEEVTLIEQKWEAERQKLEADRKHTLNRLHGVLKESQVLLVMAKDEAYKARGTDAWIEKKLTEKTVSASVADHFQNISETNRYYQNEFKALRDKRDEELRKLNTKYSEERSHILMQVEYPAKEDQVKYWRAKYHQLKAEFDKLKASA